MKTVKLTGKTRKSEYLTRPVYFSQSLKFDSSKTYQFNNRNVDKEYVYDIDFDVEREVEPKELIEMQNALHSVLYSFGDKVCDDSIIVELLISQNESLKSFMKKDGATVNYLAKRFVLANYDDIGFVSDYVVLKEEGEKIAL